MKINNREIKNLSKVEEGYQLKIDNMCIKMKYSEKNKSFNECMVNILKQKIGK